MTTREMIHALRDIGDCQPHWSRDAAESFLISVAKPAIRRRCARLRNINKASLAARLKIEYYNTLYALGLEKHAKDAI